MDTLEAFGLTGLVVKKGEWNVYRDWEMNLHIRVGTLGLLFGRVKWIKLEVSNVSVEMEFVRKTKENGRPSHRISKSTAEELVVKGEEQITAEDDSELNRESILGAFFQLFFLHFQLIIIRFIFWFLVNFEFDLKNVTLNANFRIGDCILPLELKKFQFNFQADYDLKYPRRIRFFIGTKEMTFLQNGNKIVTILPISFDILLTMYNRKCPVRVCSVALTIGGFNFFADDSALCQLLDFVANSIDRKSKTSVAGTNFGHTHPEPPDFELGQVLLLWFPFLMEQKHKNPFSEPSPEHTTPVEDFSKKRKFLNLRDNGSPLFLVVRWLDKLLSVKSKTGSRMDITPSFVHHLFQWLPTMVKISVGEISILVSSPTLHEQILVQIKDIAANLNLILANSECEHASSAMHLWLSESFISVNLSFNGPNLKLITTSQIIPEISIGKLVLVARSDLLFLLPPHAASNLAPVAPKLIKSVELMDVAPARSPANANRYFIHSGSAPDDWLNCEESAPISFGSLNIEFQGIYVCIGPGLEPWLERGIDIVNRFIKSLPEQSNLLEKCTSKDDINSDLGFFEWAGQRIFKLTLCLCIRSIDVVLKSDYFSTLEEYHCITLAKIAIQDIFFRNLTGFTLYSARFMDKKLLDRVSLGSLAQRRNKETPNKSIGPTYLYSVVPSDIIFLQCFLAICASIPLFSTGSIQIFALCSKYDSGCDESISISNKKPYLEFPFQLQNRSDLVFKRAVHLLSVNGQFSLKGGLLLDASNIVVWLAPSFLQISAPILKLLFDYTRALRVSLVAEESRTGINLRDNLELPVCTRSIILTVNNWYIESSCCLVLNPTESQESVRFSYYITGGLGAIHIRPDLKRWSVFVLNISLSQRKLSDTGEIYQASAPLTSNMLYGTPFLHIREVGFEGVDPVWKIIQAEVGFGYLLISPQQMHVSASGVSGNWDCQQQVCILRLVKQFVAAAINFKASSYHYVWPKDSLHSYYPAPDAIDLERYISEALDPLCLLDADRFLNWYQMDRASYLLEKFSLVTLDLKDIHLIFYFDCYLWMQLDCESMSSNYLPLNFNFDGVELSCVSERFISVAHLNVERKGFSVDDCFGEFCKNSEQLTLFGDYADVILHISSPSIFISPRLRYDTLIHSLSTYSGALLLIYENLPRLDFLSRMLGGPGYTGPPAKPSPCVNILIENFELRLLDNSLESFIQNAYSIWMKAALERARISEIVSQRSAFISENKIDVIQMQESMRLYDSSYYLELMKSVELKKRLDVANLVFLSSTAITIDIGLVGKYGSFRSKKEIFRALLSLDESNDNEEDFECNTERFHSNPQVVETAFSNLLGNYQNFVMKNVCVYLRDFPYPLFKAAEISMSGATIIAMRDTSNQFTLSKIVPLSGNSFYGIKSLVTRSYVPIKLFFDLQVSLQKVIFTFSPSYLFTLMDLMQIVRYLCSLCIDPSDPLSYWDLIRYVAHGRCNVGLEDMCLMLLLPQSRSSLDRFDPKLLFPDNVKNCIQVRANQIDLNYETGAIGVNILQTRVLLELGDGSAALAPDRKSEFICLPRIEIQIGLQWESLGNPKQHYIYPFSKRIENIGNISTYSPQLLIQSSMCTPLLENLLGMGFKTVSHWLPVITENDVSGMFVHGSVSRQEVLINYSPTNVDFKLAMSKADSFDLPCYETSRTRLWEILFPYLTPVSNEDSPRGLDSPSIGILTAPFALRRAILQADELNAIPKSITFDSFSDFRSTGLNVSMSIMFPLAPILFQKSVLNATKLSRKLSTHLLHFPRKIVELDDTFDAMQFSESVCANVYSGSLVSLLTFAMHYLKFPPQPFPKRNCSTLDVNNQISRVLGGLIVERFYMHRIILTFWEGSSSGAARGLRLGVNGITFCSDILREKPEEIIPTLSVHYRSPKIFLDLYGVLWSIANTSFSLDRVCAHVVANEEWKSLHAYEESNSLFEDIKSGKCVVAQVYENQRYVLGQGWGGVHLLPTDRGPWTDDTGAVAIDKESIKVPSSDWTWMGDWQVDFVLRNIDEVDGCGFEYAVDFPNALRKWDFIGKWTWFTSVRRRRWIRIRTMRNHEDDHIMKAKAVDPKETSHRDFIFNIESLNLVQERVYSSVPHVFTTLAVPSLSKRVSERREPPSGASLLDLFNIGIGSTEQSTATSPIQHEDESRPKLKRYRAISANTMQSQMYVLRAAIQNVKVRVALNVRDVILALALSYFEHVFESLGHLIQGDHFETLRSVSSTNDANFFVEAQDSSDKSLNQGEDEDFKNRLVSHLSPASIKSMAEPTESANPDLQNFFLLEIFYCQCNIRCENKGSIAISLAKATLDHRVFWRNNFHDRYEISLVIDRACCWVAPNDIDVNPLATWLKRGIDDWNFSVCVLKPIMEPVCVACTAFISSASDVFKNLFSVPLPAAYSTEISQQHSNLTFLNHSPDYVNCRSKMNTIVVRVPPVTVDITDGQMVVISGILTSLIMTPFPTVASKSDDHPAHEHEFALVADEATNPWIHVRLARENRNNLAWALRGFNWLLELNKNSEMSRFPLVNAVFSRDPKFASLQSVVRANNDDELTKLGEYFWTRLAVAQFRYHRLRKIYYQQELLFRNRQNQEHLKNISVDFCLERLRLYLSLESQTPFFFFQFQDLCSKAVVYEDLTIEFTLELNNLSLENLLEKGDRKFALGPLLAHDQEWTEKNIILIVRAMVKIDKGTLVTGSVAEFPHVELNMHPLNVKLTWPFIDSVIKFFSDGSGLTKENEAKRAEEMKRKFLPVTHLLTSSDVTKMAKTELPATPQAARIHKRSVMESLSIDPSASQNFSISLLSNSELFKLATEIYSFKKKDEKSRQDSLKSSNAEDGWFFFNYFRAGTFKIVMSYHGNNIGVEDFEGLKVTIKTIIFQQKRWSLQTLASRLQKELIFDLLGQIGGTLGSLIKYKFGFGDGMKRLAQGEEDSSIVKVVDDEDDSSLIETVSGFFSIFASQKALTKKELLFGSKSKEKFVNAPMSVSAARLVASSPVNTLSNRLIESSQLPVTNFTPHFSSDFAAISEVDEEFDPDFDEKSAELLNSMK